MVLSKEDPGYIQCAISVMDNIADPGFSVDEKGICNYYYEYQEKVKNELFSGVEGEKKLEELVRQIKEEGKGKKYDCITGISGGVDSSYLIMLARKWGLRTLVVHFDNGWNTEIAVRNINNVIQKTGFDLFTIVVNWEEFKDLQLAYIKAGVVDLEVPTDHAIIATWYKLAKKYKIKTVLSGNNISTEAVLPNAWMYNKTDYVSLMGIHKKFGTVPIKTFPVFGFKQHYFETFIKGVKNVKPLNLVGFDKEKAKEAIKKEFDWMDYGGKHYESMYTKFYQAYILPRRFHIDKRKAHLSNLIFSGQITKEQALAELEKPLYDPVQLQHDIDFVIKKFGITRDEFEMYMTMPYKKHEDYGKQPFISDRFPIIKLINPVYKAFKKLLAK